MREYRCYTKLLMYGCVISYSLIIIFLLISNNNLIHRVDYLYKIEITNNSNSNSKSNSKSNSNVNNKKFELYNNPNKNIDKQHEELKNTKLRVDNLKTTIVNFKDNIDNIDLSEKYNKKRFSLTIDIITILYNFITTQHEENIKKNKHMLQRIELLEQQMKLNTEMISYIKH